MMNQIENDWDVMQSGYGYEQLYPADLTVEQIHQILEKNTKNADFILINPKGEGIYFNKYANGWVKFHSRRSFDFNFGGYKKFSLADLRVQLE